MKIPRNKTVKIYKNITLKDFVKQLVDSTSLVSASNVIFFDEIVKEVANTLNMAKTDVIRAIGFLIRDSRTFRLKFWFFPSFTSKGSVAMTKTFGRNPLGHPFDSMSLRSDVNEHDLCNIVNEATGKNIRKVGEAEDNE